MRDETGTNTNDLVALIAIGLVLCLTNWLVGCEHDAQVVPEYDDEGHSGVHSPSRARGKVESVAVDDRDYFEEEIRSLVEVWVQAQNNADFTSYVELYADQFSGVKGSDPSPRIVDRTRWVEWSETQFGQARIVEVDEIDISTAGDSAAVYLSETVHTLEGRFRGLRELVIVRSEQGLSIWYEEPLERVELPPPVEMELPSAEEFAMVVRSGNGDGVHILVDDSPDESWFAQERQYLGTTAAQAPVVEDQLPRRYVSWPGRAIELYDDEGQSCSGRVSALYGLGRASPHFGLIQRWEGRGKADSQGPMKRSQVADELWEIADDPLLVAHVELAEPGDCDNDLLWARHLDTDTEALSAVELDEDIRQTVLHSFRSDDEYVHHQQVYKEYGYASAATWSNFDGASPDVWAFENQRSQRIFVLVSARAGRGCADFAGSMSVLYELVHGEGGIRPIALSRELGAMDAAAMVDLGDGAIPAVVGRKAYLTRPEVLLRRRGAAHQVVQKLPFPFYGCAC